MANISHFTQIVNGVSTTYDIHDANALTTEIDSMGTGWIRFKSGLQICYGTVNNNNNLATGIARYTFPKSFIATPSMVASPNLSGKWVMTALVEGTTTWVLNTFAAWISPIDYSDGAASACFVAVGKWK